MVDERFSYWILNDSDRPVTVDVREQLHRTFDIPPHTYAALAGGMGRVQPEWTIAFLDASCRPIQVLAMDPKSDLVYVGPGGAVSLVDANAWGYGSRTATSTTVGSRPTLCPSPSVSPPSR